MDWYLTIPDSSAVENRFTSQWLQTRIDTDLHLDNFRRSDTDLHRDSSSRIHIYSTSGFRTISDGLIQIYIRTTSDGLLQIYIRTTSDGLIQIYIRTTSDGLVLIFSSFSVSSLYEDQTCTVGMVDLEREKAPPSLESCCNTEKCPAQEIQVTKTSNVRLSRLHLNLSDMHVLYTVQCTVHTYNVLYCIVYIYCQSGPGKQWCKKIVDFSQLTVALI